MAEKFDEFKQSSLMSFFLHQDNLMWSRLQTIGVIQISVLSSSYALKSNCLISFFILLFGIILSVCVFFLFKRDEVIRMKIEKQINILEYHVDRLWYAPLKGREIIWIILISLITADVILGCGIYFSWI